ncbi:alpha/beta hydrolase [Maribacter cobaltidurans]|uniref:1,4-beta-xylanase n=1 Tax=Maribacter cobaltidurans TaxID=1178778 RepID=A0A223V170_9FLAO|nr:alpha/beta hydrolase [Maribacter cobaltidurans]ASV29074.1 1,4-beta-xylanase [Maribacter cobaltidurans]GGD72136.1 endo-1,4-beta-xylanase [Maribacter cobaltidurans]
MKKIATSLILCITTTIFAQEIIELPYETTQNVSWEGGEKEYYSDIWQTQVVTNVSTPTMEVFAPENPNGTSVIIAPGGGLYALSINSEGNDVAKWLVEKGITAFVLKYRLVPTGSDGVQEITQEGGTNPQKIMQRVAPVLPLSINDGLSAIEYVRTNAQKYKLDPNKIGFMGFSAGGAVTMGVAYNYNEKNRPDFIVPVYPWTTAQPVQEVPQTAPSMLVICATDDPLGLAIGSIELYSSWLKANKPAGLHMYSKGGHGFGMKTQNLPSDNWIQRFHDWWKVEISTKETKVGKM